MRFTFGKKQRVNGTELDSLFTDLQTVLKRHPLIPTENIDTLITEWVNDILFIKGLITEEELEEAAEKIEEDEE
ncbi:hypothetical protein KEJ39_07185 [Candidatus Bathyarchaeota archaeon]|nr:hypothetical protein [Candidatus Bathyarchaeota archaeon]